MTKFFKATLILLTVLFTAFYSSAQLAMINVFGRQTTSLNGKWQYIVDPTNVGDWREIWKEKAPVAKTDFFEYGFSADDFLNVPADFNTQKPELTYYEGIIWYKKAFKFTKSAGKRQFIHFGAVNYLADVYLNGQHLGQHEGGFTPFQFEITSILKEGENSLIVKVNSARQKNGLPGTGYDWFNYGGITRDVNLIETSATYIDDYSVQLAQNSSNIIEGWLKLDGVQALQSIKISLPELKLEYVTQTDSNGLAKFQIKAKLQLWSPQNPKLYQVIIKSETDSVADQIGFRSIKVNGPQIVLNGQPIFLKSINLHEENPIRASKAFNDADALIMLTWAKELGCNMVRLAHYPHNEYMVKMAEQMGLMVWSELPVYQHIEFSAPGVEQKMENMLHEMIKRDRNRCGVVIWSLANETWTTTPNRHNALAKLAKTCRQADPSRPITAVMCNQGYTQNTVNVWDSLYRYFDIISINEYIGWYVPWQGEPSQTKWEQVCPDKPVFISEFGGEAQYGNHQGPADEARWWNEEYQEQIYRDQIEMFKTIPNLVGVCPWILADFRSLSRLHPVYQQGWNRKGVISDRGEKKKAWFVLKQYYDTIK